MAATNLPLCPCCLTRVLAWTATRCPACQQTAPISNCDRCMRSRAGSFVTAGGSVKGPAGSQEPFLCRDCMEETLEEAVDGRCTETIWVVAIVLFGVYWWKWMPAWATLAAFALALVAFARWILAAQRRNAPGKRRAAALRYFEQRIAKSKQSRAKALK
jgi:hypothetical protein